LLEQLNSTWDLSILDSWRGLMKGISTGLINLSAFNPEEYEYYDHPMHGDMHVMVPGKFIAFKGVFAFFSFCSKPMHGDMHVLVPGTSSLSKVCVPFKGVCACVCVHMPAMSGAMFEGRRGLM